jgi:hypothetical protein
VTEQKLRQSAHSDATGPDEVEFGPCDGRPSGGTNRSQHTWLGTANLHICLRKAWQSFTYIEILYANASACRPQSSSFAENLTQPRDQLKEKGAR